MKLNKLKFTIIFLLVFFMTIKLAYCGYTGLDEDDDIYDLSFSTGDPTIDNILNFALGALSSFIEILYDALLKTPLLILSYAWIETYNGLIGWGLAGPLAWASSVLLFLGTAAIGTYVIMWLIDVLG